jgi:hypothetical protein
MYDPLNPELVAARARDRRQQLNGTRESEEPNADASFATWVGSRAVIGAGGAVTRDVREAVFAAGKPCRVIRAITD